MKKVRVRFAPSPTGLLHVGNARTALFNWLYARQKNGVNILRIEDTDVERSTLQYQEKLMADLRWLGLSWDEGPDVGGQFGPYRQSLRLDIYKKFTQKLLDQEKAYYCFCTPEELEQARKNTLGEGKTPVYSGKCRLLSPPEGKRRMEAGEKPSVRLRTPGKGTLSFNDLVRDTLSFQLELVGDPILVRSSGVPAYNYAVVVDDYLMEITHVIRGEDHLANTVRQLLIFDAFGVTPPQYAHLSMVMGEDNTRLSKRHGATSVDQFKQDGILNKALLNYLALLGWSSPDGKEILTPDELVKLFSLQKVSRSAAIFDHGKLHWLNRQHMGALSSREQAEQAAVHLGKAGLLPDTLTEGHWQWLEQTVPEFIKRADRFSDLIQSFSELFEYSPDKMGDEAKVVLQSDCAFQVIRIFNDKLTGIKDFDYENFTSMVHDIKEKTGCKGKDLFLPLRVALTARTSGVELDKFIPMVQSGTKLSFPFPLKSCAGRVAEILDYLQTTA